MSDLSRDARDLIAQAKKDGPALLGPSVRDRARVREKLTPLWAANAALPSARYGWVFRVGSAVVIAGLAALGWIARPYGSQPAAHVSTTPPPSATTSTTAESSIAPGAHGASTPEPAHQAGGRESAARERPALHVSRQAPGKRASIAARAPVGVGAEPAGQRTAHDERVAGDEHSSTNVAPRAAAALAKLPTADFQSAANVAPQAATASATAPTADAHSSAAHERAPLTAASNNGAAHSDMHPSPPSIDGELELLSAAQSALQQQRPSRALNLLQEHAFRFPTGALSEERMALQALALCASGRKHAAQTVLSTLEARPVPSQLLPRVRSQCGL